MPMKRKVVLLWTTLVVLLLAASTALTSQDSHPICLLEVTGTIDPALARYVTRGLEEARKDGASAVVVQMDTPGGLDGSMRRIVQGILNSPVPVIVYVAPSGARAASAGAFITLAAHVAAMAPGTNIGAAHPVEIGGRGGSEESKEKGGSSIMETKLTNDAVAYIRSIVDIRGRNLEWAEASVRESRSASAPQAKEERVIDVIAKDMDDLILQLEGRQVKTVSGVTTLALKGQPVKRLAKSFMEAGLHQLAHPNIAYILLLLGIYGLIFELSTPGATFPGVLGSILLILGLVSLETLDVNWAGMALIFLSLFFFIADIKLPTHGALSIGGIVSFVIGSLMLFPSARIPDLSLPWSTVGASTVVTAGFFIVVVGAGLKALARKVTSGVEGLIGLEGVAKTDLKPEGLVNVKGEEWQARADSFVKKGARVRVVRLEGLTVHVESIVEGS